MLKLIASVASVKRALDELFMFRAMQTSIFPGAPEEFLQGLVQKAQMKSFKKGDVIFKEGEIGDAFYVIRKGSVKVSRLNRSGVDVAQTYVPAGHYVGEMAVLREEPMPRSATCTAAVACDTIVIKKEDANSLLSQFLDARRLVVEVADQRRVQNAVVNWNEGSGELLDFMMREGLTDAENVLLIDSDLCVACDNCEAACAATHGGYSRLDRKGGKSFAAIQLPISCRHCENPLCMLDCPPDALVRQADGEVVIKDSCIGCGNCAGNCPYGVIKLVYDHAAAGFSLMDVDSLVRHRLPVVMVVGNNSAWGLEKGPMQMLYGYDVVADLAQRTPYDEVVRALGGAGETVTDPKQIGPALDRAYAAGVPYLVNVITDVEAAYPRSTFGI